MPTNLELDEWFSLSNLTDAFWRNVASSSARGIDRISPNQFARRLPGKLETVRQKCKDGTYKFAPYLEVLQLKSREKPPRTISIPTVRDRLVLHILKEILHSAFADCVPRTLPNDYIRQISAQFETHRTAAVVKADIVSFYDNIDHRRLLSLLSNELPAHVHRLVERAIRNPTVKRDEHRADDSRLRPISAGVPQGLAISNILAEIYVRDVDAAIEAQGSLPYFRYVDDILVFVEPGKEDSRYGQIRSSLADAGLELSDEKKFYGPIQMPFEYLGYHLELPRISVREATRRRFIDSLAAMFARYHYGVEPRYRGEWLSAEARRLVFVEELNERITGAVSENRRYGWLFYFSEINDLSLLYRIDKVIGDIWNRYMKGSGRATVKRLVRAYYEVRYAQLGEYIHNYNRYDTLKRKLEFLVRRGYLDPASTAQFTDEQIELMFAQARGRNLARLEADVGLVS